MARGSRIKGITIELDANITPLQKALGSVDKSLKNTQASLKDVNKLLKLDPSNTDLLKQKQELLKQSIDDTKDRLKTLNEAYKQLDGQGTEEAKQQQEMLAREISETEQNLKSLKKEYSDFGSVAKQQLQNVGNSLKEVGGKVTDVGKDLSMKLTAPIVGFGTLATKEAADLEQVIGGVETLFGEASGTVIENANKAYKTAGLSANEYMENVTSFAASLNQALGGDVVKAAEVADMALIDMADNANKMGSDISSIQNAYQGFAKQNYTMLDNLKLGYGGTKTEMERLLKDAQKLTGIKYDINNLSDVYNAIHVIQEDLGITGTTALESSETLSGSLASLKAQLSNVAGRLGSVLLPVITSIVNKVGKLVEKFASMDDKQKKMIVTILAVVAAVGPVIAIIGSIISGVGTLISTIGMLFSPLGLVVAAITAVIAIGVALYKNWDTIKAKAVELFNNLRNTFSNLKTNISNVFTNIKNTVTSVWSTIKSTITDKVNGIWSSITGTFAKITNFVSEQVQKLKNMFNFKWELPQIKLPHFFNSGNTGPLGLPKIQVEWYSKAMRNGMILDSPTIFGASNGRLLGGGEAGSETIVGTNSLMNMIRQASQGTSINGDIIINMNVPKGANGKQLVDQIEKELSLRMMRRNEVY